MWQATITYKGQLHISRQYYERYDAATMLVCEVGTIYEQISPSLNFDRGYTMGAIHSARDYGTSEFVIRDYSNQLVFELKNIKS